MRHRRKYDTSGAAFAGGAVALVVPNPKEPLEHSQPRGLFSGSNALSSRRSVSREYISNRKSKRRPPLDLGPHWRKLGRSSTAEESLDFSKVQSGPNVLRLRQR